MMIDWNNVFIEAAIAAMQGIQESGKFGIAADVMPEKLADISVKIARCLVSRLKKEIDGEQNQQA